MELHIDPTGTIRCIYTEAIALAEMGALQIRRASHVDADHEGRWWANMAPVTGGRLGPFGCRSDALRAEADWLRRHWHVVVTRT